MSLITDWSLKCHSHEARGGQHTSLMTDYACGRDHTNMGGNITVKVCYRCATSTVLLAPRCYACCLHPYATFTERLDPWCSGLPIQEVSDIVTRQTKVLAIGEK